MNPARSRHRTGCLPAATATAAAVSATSGKVLTVLTTSTSFITGAGLKKCRPTTSAGRFVAIASSITGRLEVVVARTAPGLQISSNVSNSACLTLSSSTTASTTRSAPARSSSFAVPVIRLSAASRSSSESLPRWTAFSSDRSSAAATFATFSVPRATYTTSYPALAQTSTMPMAIVPEPTTPTCLTGRPPVPAASEVGVSSSSTTTGESGAS
jgi:hypothetical protein